MQDVRSPFEAEATATDEYESDVDPGVFELFEDAAPSTAGENGWEPSSETGYTEAPDTFGEDEGALLLEALPTEHPLAAVFSLPRLAFDAMAKNAWPAAIAIAVGAGVRDVDKLTDMVFWFQNPQMIGQKIRRDQPELARTWLRIRDQVVKPAIAGGFPAVTTPASTTGLLFDRLWANHPSNQTPPEQNPCRQPDGTEAFANQCVIRIGEAMTRSGLSLASYPGAFCWFGHHRRHPLRVEEMVVWLNTTATGFSRRGQVSRIRGGHQKTHADFAGQRGVVAFLDFWGRGNRGDHIDVWDGARMASGNNDYFARSRAIWFWPLA